MQNKTLKHFNTFLEMFYFTCNYGLKPTEWSKKAVPRF